MLAMLKATPLTELVYATRRSKSRSEAQRRAQEAQLKECTFKPSIKQSPPNTPWGRMAGDSWRSKKVC